MLDEKTFKKELVRMWDSLRSDRYKGYCSCSGLSCNRCPLYKIGCREPMNTFKMIDVVEKWSKEHPLNKYKISKLEYDIIKACILEYDIIKACIDSCPDSCHFYDNGLLMTLLNKGYFKGADGEMYLEDYFKNCEVEDDKEEK